VHYGLGDADDVLAHRRSIDLAVGAYEPARGSSRRNSSRGVFGAIGEGGMKRFLIFTVSPVLAILFVAYMVRGANIPTDWLLAIYGMVLAMSFIPFLADWALASRLALKPRVVVVGLVGAAVSLAYDSMLNSYSLRSALTGALVGAVCSWLSSEKQNRRAQ
jgi:hypothetical protein